MTTKRISAIFLKEIQDIKTNNNVIIMLFIPILLTLLWEFIVPDMPAGMGLGMGLMFLVIMVGMYVPAMLIAEEKEKKTIEVLLLSPATPLEILIGKGLLTFISILVTGILLLVITGAAAQSAVIITGLILTSIFSIMLGMVIGLLAPNQMATGIIGTPIYLILLLVPNLAIMGVEIMNTIGKLLPNYYFFNMIRASIEKGKGLETMYLDLATLGVSIVITLFILLYVFRKKGLKD